MKVRFSLIIDLGDGAVDDDEWRDEVIMLTGQLERQLEEFGDLEMFSNGLRWEPVE